MVFVQRGFSLVETLIATTLLAIALVALAQFVSAAAASGTVARVRAVSTNIATQKLEEIRALPWSSVSAMPANSIEYLDAGGRRSCGDAATPCGEATYVRRWSATPAPFSSGVLIIEITAGAIGKAHGSTTLVTARARLTP